jgi:hypothetical protein
MLFRRDALASDVRRRGTAVLHDYGSPVCFASCRAASLKCVRPETKLRPRKAHPIVMKHGGTASRGVLVT